jgi:hypothetical protein
MPEEGTAVRTPLEARAAIRLVLRMDGNDRSQLSELSLLLSPLSHLSLLRPRYLTCPLLFPSHVGVVNDTLEVGSVIPFR